MPTFCCFPGVPGTELVLRLGGSLGDRRAQEAWATIVKERRNGGGQGTFCQKKKNGLIRCDVH